MVTIRHQGKLTRCIQDELEKAMERMRQAEKKAEVMPIRKAATVA